MERLLYIPRRFFPSRLINVSVYKINSFLAIVGDLFMGCIQTGMIYVYARFNQPMDREERLACSCKKCYVDWFLIKPLWTMNRLHVVSLGTDNYLRL